jgi:peptidyl-prolyl cis-trans isomerase B (cyclophilin B)
MAHRLPRPRAGYHRPVTSPRRFSALFVIPLLALTAGCGSDDAPAQSSAPDAQCSYTDKGVQSASKKVEKPTAEPAADAPAEVTIATDRGDIKISLDSEKVPCAVNSFSSLAKQGFYDDTPCHRLVASGQGGLNVLQCGDPTGTGTGGPGYRFDEELIDQDPRLQPCLGQVDDTSGKEFCTFPAGTVAMAKTLEPGSTGSQFFLVFQDSILDASYTVMGRMSAAGLNVVRAVAKEGIGPDGVAPKQPVTITSVK